MLYLFFFFCTVCNLFTCLLSRSSLLLIVVLGSKNDDNHGISRFSTLTMKSCQWGNFSSINMSHYSCIYVNILVRVLYSWKVVSAYYTTPRLHCLTDVIKIEVGWLKNAQRSLLLTANRTGRSMYVVDQSLVTLMYFKMKQHGRGARFTPRSLFYFSPSNLLSFT